MDKTKVKVMITVITPSFQHYFKILRTHLKYSIFILKSHIIDKINEIQAEISPALGVSEIADNDDGSNDDDDYDEVKWTKKTLSIP